MSRHFVRTAALTAGLALAAAPLAAQSSPGPQLEVAPYAGYMLFGHMLEGPLGTSLGSAGGMAYGAQLGIPLTSNLSLVANVAHASPALQVGIPILGGIEVGRSSVWMYDAGLQIKLPSAALSARRIAPFIQVGAGAMHYAIDVSALTTRSSNFAANAGIGADVDLAPGVGLRLMAKDYVGKFDFQQATGLGLGNGISHNWALSAGVRLGF